MHVLTILLDPPRFDPEELEIFKTPVTVKKGHKASFKLPFVGKDPIKVQWYLDGEELSEESNIKIENSEGYTRLHLMKLQRKDSGEVKIKLKNEFGTIEAFSQLIVLGAYWKLKVTNTYFDVPKMFHTLGTNIPYATPLLDR